jgi:hypothetical protein
MAWHDIDEADIGDLLGVSTSTVYGRLSSKSSRQQAFGWKEVVRLGQAFGAPMEWFLTGMIKGEVPELPPGSPLCASRDSNPEPAD